MDILILLLFALLAANWWQNRTPSLVEISKDISQGGLKFVGVFPLVSPGASEYCNSRVNAIYAKMTEKGKIIEVLFLSKKWYGGGYFIRLVDDEVEWFQQGRTKKSPNRQDLQYTNLILGKLQQAEALRD